MILSDRVEKVSNSLDKIRLYRSSIGIDFAFTQEETKKYVDRKDDENLEHLLKNFNEKMSVIEEWIHRLDDHYTYDELAKTPDGIDYLIDAFLPLSWNYDRDLIFLFSDHALNIIPNLIKRGQSNIIYFTDQYHNIPNVVCISDLKYLPNSLMSFLKTPKIAAIIEPIKPNDKKSGYMVGVKSELDKHLRMLSIRYNTNIYFSKVWIEHKIQNLPALVHAFDIESIKCYFTKKPVIIVNPGPSLEKDIEKIQSIRNNVLIVAPTQSIKALSKQKLSPDFLLMLDSGDFINHLDGVDTSRLKAFIYYDVVNPQMFNAHPTIPKVSLSSANEFFSTSDIIPLPKFPFGGASVSIVALKIAVGLGAEVVGLMGQDLAISEGSYYIDPEGRAADKNLTIHKKQEETITAKSNSEDVIFHDGRWHRSLEVEANSGEQVVTIPSYWSFIIEIEDFALYVKKNVKIYNFSFKGAKIEDVEYISFTDFCSKFLTKEIEGLNIQPKLTFLQLEMRRNSVKNKLTLINITIEEYVKTLTKIISSLQKKDNRKIEKYENDLKSISRNSLFMEFYFQNIITRMVSHFESNNDVNYINKELFNFYSSLRTDAVRLRKIVQNVMKTIEKKSEKEAQK